MKRFFVLFIADGLVASTFSEVDGQQRRRRRNSSAQINAGPSDSTYYYKGRRGRSGAMGKTINESTTGVLGQDTIKMNSKGRHRNLNQNTGQPLPPNNGKVGGL